MTAHRRAFGVTCRTHGGPAGFANLLVTRVGDVVVLDAHATGVCVLELNEHVATSLSALIVEWFGRGEPS